MTNIKVISYSSKTVNIGFTIIELVVVIVILGILSVTVAPKFFTSSGFSEYAYRSDAIAKLRLIQTKAMQQTNVSSDYCHRVLLTTTQLGAPDDCDNSPSFATNWIESATRLEIDSNDNVLFSSNIGGNSFVFDSMGRPDSCGPCDITITGEQAIVIRIEKEGYIHAL